MKLCNKGYFILKIYESINEEIIQDIHFIYSARAFLLRL